MASTQNQTWQERLKHFAIPGEFVEARPFGGGHINSTFLCTVRQGGAPLRFLFQQINTQVFREPGQVMTNILKVTEHLRRQYEALGKSDLSRRVMRLVPTWDGPPFVEEANGEVWRALVFVEGAASREELETPGQAREAARIFGEFLALLADLPASELYETIPRFLHGPNRYALFLEALEKDPCNRAREVREEIAFLQARKETLYAIQVALDSGEIPSRVAHNDTKINNVLLDQDTGEALCAVDLDTVMPGTALYDFGDLFRTCLSPAAEDEPDLSRVQLRLPIYRALLEGYLEGAGDSLTPREIALLPLGGVYMTLLHVCRFLTDYLLGDVYYKTTRPGQNLDRCRTQKKLVEEAERYQAELEPSSIITEQMGL